LAHPPAPKANPAPPSRDDTAATLAAVQQETTTLRDRLEVLGKPFQTKNLEQLLVQSGKPDATPATLLEIQALLSSPLVKGETRSALWKAGLVLSRQLHERMVAADADKDHPPPPVPPYSDGERKRFDSLERERAAGRAALSIGLLRLGGLDDAEPLEQEWKRMHQASAGADWNSLGGKLRIAWSRQVPARLKELLDKDDLPEAECLSRIVPPLDLAVAPPARLTADLHRRQAETAWRWLAGFYREEAKHFRDGSPAAKFYRRASDEFLQSAP
jgi:hypothetical protein